MPLNDTLTFLRAWMRAPRSIGALTPSGPSLARLMTTHINHLDGPVIELGPGTGVFTRALLARGIPTHRLALIEADPVFGHLMLYADPERPFFCLEPQSNTPCAFNRIEAGRDEGMGTIVLEPGQSVEGMIRFYPFAA